jgi:RHH-type proline utilization regulon transcriptional repressor/proline dehydrogenase/delta 1-pyrroline-5-carboxylate dehydrogenase
MLVPDVDTLSGSALRTAVRNAYRTEEQAHVAMLAEQAGFADDAGRRVRANALELMQHVRTQRREVGGIDALMQHYDLSSQEGVTLMCLAEALLRIPDAATMDDLIEDKSGWVSQSFVRLCGRRCGCWGTSS